MKNKLYITIPYLFSIGLLIFSLSCSRKELIEEIQIKNNDSKLVVFSLITPNKYVFVNVRKTQPIGESNNVNTKDSTFDLVSTAKVEIINLRTKIKKILPEIEKGVYGVSPSDFSVIAGDKYALMINFQNLSTYAECTIPSNATVIDTVITKLNDVVYTNTYDTTTLNLSRNLLKAKDISTPNNVYEYLGYSGELKITDKYNNVVILSASDFIIITKQLNQCDFSINSGLNKNEVKIVQSWQILTVYPLLHNFLKTKKFQRNELSVSQNSPFLIFRGVMPTITNIQNGYGIFAGYLISPPKQITVTR